MLFISNGLTILAKDSRHAPSSDDSVQQEDPKRASPVRVERCATQKFHLAVFNPIQHCYILIAGVMVAQL